MLSTFIKHIPNHRFWLFNLLFWLILNTLATDNRYRQALSQNYDADWITIWVSFLPWWTLWALLAPLVIAATKMATFNPKKPLAFIYANLLMALIFLVIMSWGLTIVIATLIATSSFSWHNLVKVFKMWQLNLLHIDLLAYLAIVCVGYTVHYYSQSKRQQLSNEKLARQLVQVELQSLKSQLNPHFLFNTLNTIASLIRLDDKDKAINALSELSLMLRKVLEHQSEQLISMQEELDFITSYLAIQKMRFADKLITEINVNQACLTTNIPFMLLQPLVENAVQHGSQLSKNSNKLTLDIRCDQQTLMITLINQVPDTDEHKGFGIGLKNCKERLRRLYNDNFQLNLTPLDNGYFETFLSLPCGGQHD